MTCETEPGLHAPQIFLVFNYYLINPEYCDAMFNKLFMAFIACSLVYGGETVVPIKPIPIYLMSGDSIGEVNLSDQELEILHRNSDHTPGGLVQWNSETIGIIRKILKIEVQDLSSPFQDIAQRPEMPAEDLATKELLYNTPDILFNHTDNSITLVNSPITGTTHAQTRLRKLISQQAQSNIFGLEFTLQIFNPTYTLKIVNMKLSADNSLTQDEVDNFFNKETPQFNNEEINTFVTLMQNNPTNPEEFWESKPMVINSKPIYLIAFNVQNKEYKSYPITLSFVNTSLTIFEHAQLITKCLESLYKENQGIFELPNRGELTQQLEAKFNEIWAKINSTALPS
jgi:hypothetical protein